MFVSLKERLYGYYVGFLLFFGSFVFTVNSLYSPFASPQIVQSLHSIVPIATIFFVLFSSQLLGFERVVPKIKKLLDIILIVLIILVFLINFSISPWYGVMNATIPIIYILLTITTITATLHGVKKAKVYLVALLLLITNVEIMASMYDGVLPSNDFNQYSFMVVALMEFLLFTIILANKINEESAQKLIAEEQLLAEQEVYAQRLEREVEYRTKELENLNIKLIQIAKTDQLTQICNRVGLDTVWCEHKDKGTLFGIGLIDIDHFKNVNDTYGHQVGDHVLKEIAKLFKKRITDNCSIGRWGGEEFMVILHGNSHDALYNLADDIRAEIASHDFVQPPSITVSFGITLVEPNDSSINNTIERADKWLYESKKNGRNRVMPKSD